MQVLSIVFSALVAVAAAAPGGSPPAQACKPGTYACQSQTAWEVCNTSGQWVYAGTCPPNTVCKFFPANQSPYCVPPSYTI
ncbi:hypothetical protein B0I35DRAFT_434004 [Stachybotrys elegans]|uniref:CBM1 domain-containing protein n=1 Tax=Stachybotrys elegans TaxID=80388 RepID=A0A8K0WQF9_9HYPO|nr:hypothetical protein B0I35DRAFT_434004 [Stachybotrys elegans]